MYFHKKLKISACTEEILKDFEYSGFSSTFSREFYFLCLCDLMKISRKRFEFLKFLKVNVHFEEFSSVSFVIALMPLNNLSYKHGW